MTTRALLLLALLARCPTAGAGVVINEIYYDHPGVDGGWEFIELYNADTREVAIDGWWVEFVDGQSGRVTRVWAAPAGCRLIPGGFLLLGGASRGVPPDRLLCGLIGNGPDAVRLLSPGETIDLVGYGNGAPAEGEPAIDGPPGSSLARRPDGIDTGNNAADLVPAEPTPGEANFHPIDISIAADDRQSPPCIGGRIVVRVALVNLGLESFTGRLSIEAFDTSDRADPSGLTVLECKLASSGTRGFEISAGIAPPGRIEMFLRVSAPGDGRSANDTCRVRFFSSPGPVVVNEIMGRPETGGEWIEIAARERVDLRGWTIRDAAGSRRLIAAESAPVEAGGFMVLARDAAAFSASWPLCPAPVLAVSGGWPALNDGGDSIELADPGGAIADVVCWTALAKAERGRSLERVSTEHCSTDPDGVWQRCSAFSGGTPGESNRGRLPANGRPAGLSVSPNPFSFSRDGEAVVVAAIRRGEHGYDLRIFDLDGRETRRLCAAASGAGTVACRWDGRDDGGRPVSTGLYVLVAAFHDTGGAVCRVEKIGVAVAAD